MAESNVTIELSTTFLLPRLLCFKNSTARQDGFSLSLEVALCCPMVGSYQLLSTLNRVRGELHTHEYSTRFHEGKTSGDHPISFGMYGVELLQSQVRPSFGTFLRAVFPRGK